MSENSFSVRYLPSAVAKAIVDANNEVSFHFIGVELRVDTVDGSFVIQEKHRGDLQFHNTTRIVTTGCIDKKGKYSFNELTSWGKQQKADLPLTANEKIFNDYNYFKNEIEFFLRQRKVHVYVR